MKKAYQHPTIRTAAYINGQILAASLDPTLDSNNTTSQGGVTSADSKPSFGYDF